MNLDSSFGFCKSLALHHGLLLTPVTGRWMCPLWLCPACRFGGRSVRCLQRRQPGVNVSCHRRAHWTRSRSELVICVYRHASDVLVVHLSPAVEDPLLCIIMIELVKRSLWTSHTSTSCRHHCIEASRTHCTVRSPSNR